MKKLGFLIILAIVCSGCESCNETDRQLHEHQAAIQLQEKADSDTCHKAGGIIIRSAWDSRIIDCKVPGLVK